LADPYLWTLQSARETNLAKKTGEIFSGVGRQAQTSYSKALENERVRLCHSTCTVFEASPRVLVSARLEGSVFVKHKTVIPDMVLDQRLPESVSDQCCGADSCLATNSFARSVISLYIECLFNF